SLVSPVVAAVPVLKQPPAKKSGSVSSELLGSATSWSGAVWWGLGCLALVLAVWLVHRRLRHWWVYVIGAAGLLVLLFYFFGQLSPLLPAGY
ncbi:MAG TPA: hypothetical protein VNV87_20285, partial [Acidimicrobiales bacterium]|nr:hypothetical protein [Acidimicrobiales bacterium]